VAESVRRSSIDLSPAIQLDKVRRGVVQHLNLSPTADPLQLAFDQFNVERLVLYVALYDLALAYAEELMHVDLNEIKTTRYDPELAFARTRYSEQIPITDPVVVAWMERLLASNPSVYSHELDTYDDGHILPWSSYHAVAELTAIDKVAKRVGNEPALSAAASASDEQIYRRFLAARALVTAAVATGLAPESLDQTSNRMLRKARLFASRQATWLTEFQDNAAGSRADILNCILGFHRAAAKEHLSPTGALRAFRASLPALCERGNGPGKRFKHSDVRDGFTWQALDGKMVPDKPLNGVRRFRWARLNPAGTTLLGSCPAMNVWPEAFDSPPLLSAVLDVAAQLAVDSIFPFADNGVVRSDYGVSHVGQRRGPALLCD
jgi:hypothetical protein